MRLEQQQIPTILDAIHPAICGWASRPPGTRR